jgi:hypothetical protein
MTSVYKTNSDVYKRAQETDEYLAAVDYVYNVSANRGGFNANKEPIMFPDLSTTSSILTYWYNTKWGLIQSAKSFELYVMDGVKKQMIDAGHNVEDARPVIDWIEDIVENPKIRQPRYDYIIDVYRIISMIHNQRINGINIRHVLEDIHTLPPVHYLHKLTLIR